MMTLEMGAPITFATQRQATVALFHFEEAARVLANYKFEERMGNGIVRREPISRLRHQPHRRPIVRMRAAQHGARGVFEQRDHQTLLGPERSVGGKRMRKDELRSPPRAGLGSRFLEPVPAPFVGSPGAHPEAW